MANIYWVGGTGDWSDATNHWATSSGGSPGAGNLPTVSDSVFFDANSGLSSGGTITIDTDVEVALFASSGVNHAYTIDNSNYWNFDIYGSLALESGMEILGQIYMASGSASYIISNGAIIESLVIGGNGICSLLTDLNVSYLELYKNFDANDFDVNAFEITIYSTSNISMGSGIWHIGHSWTIESGATINSEGSTLVIEYDNAVVENSDSCYFLDDNGTSYNIITLTTNEPLDIYGGIFCYGGISTSTLNITAGSTVYFNNGMNVVFTTLNADGTAENIINIHGHNDQEVEGDGTELVSNGGFTGNADGWTLGADWAYNSNNLSYDGSGYTAIYQDVGLISNEIYFIQLDVSEEISINIGIGSQDSYSSPFGIGTLSIVNSAYSSSDGKLYIWDYGNGIPYNIDNVSVQIAQIKDYDFNFICASGTVEVEYVNISHCQASGGATFNASNSTNGGNNTGWSFIYAYSINDSFSISDSLGKNYGITIIDELLLIDSLSTEMVYSVSISDLISMTDSILTESVFAVTISDSLTLSDNISLEPNINISDNFTIPSDSISSSLGYNYSINDSISITDSIKATYPIVINNMIGKSNNIKFIGKTIDIKLTGKLKKL